jgi:hypothetical protein
LAQKSQNQEAAGNPVCDMKDMTGSMAEPWFKQERHLIKGSSPMSSQERRTVTNSRLNISRHRSL